MHKPIVRKFNKTKVQSLFIDNLKWSTYIDSSKEINVIDTKFKVGDIVRISKYKNIFAKGYVPNWSEEIFVIKNVKNTVPWTYVISDLKGKDIVGTFYEKELQNTNQKEFRVEKVIKRKGDKPYVKWKNYDSPFNIWIDKKVKVELDLSNYATKADL